MTQQNQVLQNFKQAHGIKSPPTREDADMLAETIVAFHISKYGSVPFADQLQRSMAEMLLRAAESGTLEWARVSKR